MNLSPELTAEMHDLLWALRADAAGPAELTRLERLVREDPQARAFYVCYMHLCADLHWNSAEGRGAMGEGRGTGTSVPGVAGSGQLAVGSGQRAVCDDPPSALRPPPSPVPFIVVDNTLPSPFSPLPSFLFSYTVATIIFGIAGLCGWLYQVEHYTEFARQFGSSPAAVEQPKSPTAERTVSVARVTGLVDCRWSEPETEAFNGSHISKGRRFALTSGLLQLTYDSGAKVILQGPCTYEVDSAAGGFLSVGKLTARIEERGERRGEREGTKAEGGRRRAEEAANPKSQIAKSRISNPQSLIPNPSLPTTHYPLFTVTTPTATVTDLGTEFGVEVDKQGSTTSHVFSGSIRLQVASVDGKAAGVAQVLHENESARVEPPGGKHDTSRLVVFVPTFAPSTFVREIPKLTIKTLDLVDVVAGGDGFSRRRGRGIDPTSGLVVDTPLKDVTGKLSREINIASDGRYHRVEGLPYVDGVFIPDSRNRTVQLDSVGHTFTFTEFSNASYTTATNVWAGGAVLAVPTERIPSIRTKLGETDYASPGHGWLFLHANKGITFDMQAMRQANPNERPLRFRAVVGNTETDSDRGYSVYADVWVFVDGAARFRRRQINSSHGAFSFVVPIGRQDRFLTLVATDGGDTIAGDWILFGDPRLELVPVQTTAGLVSEKTP